MVQTSDSMSDPANLKPDQFFKVNKQWYRAVTKANVLPDDWWTITAVSPRDGSTQLHKMWGRVETVQDKDNPPDAFKPGRLSAKGKKLIDDGEKLRQRGARLLSLASELDQERARAAHGLPPKRRRRA